MEGEKRREYIMNLLSQASEPLSGTTIAKECNVSRQIIVQDIALLRVTNKNILSTYKGYLLYKPATKDVVRRTFAVQHNDDQIRDELYTIVDCGGKVLDVIVVHEIYGAITVDLILSSRKDVDEFIAKLCTQSVKPLKTLTNGHHMHTIEAASEDILDDIQDKLDEKGYHID